MVSTSLPFATSARYLVLVEVAVLVILLFVYFFQYVDPSGVGDYGSDEYFNWHPLLMTLAYPVTMSFSILAFRTAGERHLVRMQKNAPGRSTWKCCHALGHLITVALASAAFAVIYRNKDLNGYTHFGSVHSWMGALTLVSTAVMFLFGLFAFLIVRDDADWKRASLPVHRYFGYVTFVCSLATVLLGYGEIAVEGREIANLLPCGIALTIVSIGGTLFYGFIPSEGEEFDYRSVNV